MSGINFEMMNEDMGRFTGSFSEDGFATNPRVETDTGMTISVEGPPMAGGPK